MNKKKYFLLWIIVALGLQSCYQTAEVSVQNNISNVVINQVKWGGVDLGGGVLPGQQTEKKKVRKQMKRLPASETVSFVMSANGKLVFLRTKARFMLTQGDDIVITLDDATEVETPLE